MIITFIIGLSLFRPIPETPITPYPFGREIEIAETREYKDEGKRIYR